MMGNETLEEIPYRLSHSPSHLLHRAQQLAANQSASALKAAGLTLRQFAVLSILSEKDKRSQSELVDKTGIDRSTMADMVARMEKSGLLSRTSSNLDARAKLVEITAKGQSAYDTAVDAVATADEQLMNSLPKGQRKTFLAILSTFASVNELGDLDKKKSKKKTDKKKKKGKKK